MTDVPNLVSAGIQEAADTGKRLGLTWTLRPGQVTATSPLTVVHDGDILQTKIGMVSLVGYLSIGTRVMTEFVPPAGNYVVGKLVVGNTNSPTWMDYLIASGDTAIGIAETTVTGMSNITVTTTNPNARWEAEGIFDFEETVAGSTTCIGRLYVDGVLQSATALFKVSSTNDRQTTPQNWGGSFTTAGVHTFLPRVVRSAAAGTQVANATNTTFRYRVYE
jgi:hypothetical protein